MSLGSALVSFGLLATLALGLTPAQAAPTRQMSPAGAPAESGGPNKYLLGPGDSLRIVVFGEDNLSGQFAVSGDGRISFPLIGDIQASGRTVEDVQDEITSALKGRYLKDPRVSAEMLTFRPYYIYGEVNRPGEFPYTDGISAVNAIAAAGGYTYRANEHIIFLKRSNERTERKVHLSPELQVEPGDTIRVPERYF